MKFLFAFIATIFICTFISTAQAQDSLIIHGIVYDENGNGLPFTTINLDNQHQSIVSDSLGNFNFRTSIGMHLLKFICVGYNEFSERYNFKKNEENHLEITLDPNISKMQDVEVIGRKEKSYRSSSSFVGTKTSTPIKLVPQSISYVTKETLDDQLAFKTSDAIKNISGVNQFSYNNNDFVLRGFRASNTLINGLRISTRGWSQNLLPYVERVEVIKGPASALFANTDPGGTINTVTKKPLDNARKSISFVTGSYNTYRMTTDFTGPMNQNKTLLYRLNLAYQNTQSFRVLQDAEAFVIAPSFSFVPNEKTRVNFDLVYQYNKGRLDRGQPIFGASGGTDLYSTPVSFAIGRKNDFQNELNLFSTISLQHQLSKNISFNASYLKSMYQEDLLEHRTNNKYAVDSLGNEIPTLMGMSTIRRQRKNYVDNLTAYFNFNFETGPFEHNILVGYDHIQEVFPLGNSTYNASGFLSADGKSTISSFNPKKPELYQYKNGIPVPNVPYFDLQNPDYSISEISRYINVSAMETPSKYFVNGVYLQEQLRWGNLRALIGFRQEFYTDVENYTKKAEKNIQQKAFIPRFGLVYTPIEPVSFYATYTQGYQPQTASIIGDTATYGGPFDPLRSKMIEGGAKMAFFNNKLSVTVAAYRIEQNNILVNGNIPDKPDGLRQIGQQVAKGFELETYGSINRNLNITANFSYNIAKVTKSDNEEEVGTIMPNAPKSQGNIWAKYNVSKGYFNGLGIGLGANYATKRNTNSAILVLPSYWIGNAALYYQIDKFKIQANFNNILNKTYWVGGFDFNRLFPGMPRNYMISIGYTF
ncbi:TonB-dependent siderophore receptor [Rhizosphaericola mali]|uniref:TonB-dependent receptor n=1 Tax=Rhizosphaericola mali TaxID=2545455 RepID=A0A5P2G0A5_9BACT|nr:TonB-dependent siderophore receptor [Rhizosphaericola mali]QES88657.1 TonB-dependent receptor [Rhizosphaericola mali]